MEEPRPELIRAAAAGDTAAFVELVRLFEAHVWRFLRDLVGDPVVAEDVAQETFLRVYRHLGGFAFQSKFSTWLFKVARNAAVDALRREGRQHRLVRVLPVPPPSSPPDAAVELRQAVAALPRRLREALLAVEVLGLSYRETAEMLGTREGTVKSRVYYARARLAEWFEAEGGVADEV